MKQWYTLYTKPYREYLVAKALHWRGIETYLPEFKPPQVSKQRKREPLFPRYLFVKVDLERVGLSPLQWMPGLSYIVTFGDRPTPVPHQAIDLIRRKLAQLEAADERPTHAFRPGDTVRITEGPLRDMLAIFERPTTSGERVQVLLTFLGRTSRLQIDGSNLEKALPEVTAPMPKRPRRTRGRGRHIKRTASQGS